MSLENHLRESVLKTALHHLLKNQNKSPERIVRNIQDMIALLPYTPDKDYPQYEELLDAIQTYPQDQFLDWMIAKLR